MGQQELGKHTQMTYLALDPGKTTGYAIFNSSGEVQIIGIKSIEEVSEWLEGLSDDITTCIYEGYRVFPHISHKYSEVDTIKVIGMIVSWGTRRKIKMVKQFSHQKIDGYKLLGIKPPKKKRDEHQYDAVAHGVLYLVKVGIRKVGPPPR